MVAAPRDATLSVGADSDRAAHRIGHVEAILRRPVKSMGRERLEVAKLGSRGLNGDGLLAFRRIDDRIRPNRTGISLCSPIAPPDGWIQEGGCRCQDCAAPNLHLGGSDCAARP